VQDINQLLKQFDMMSGMMKQLKKLGTGGLMRHGLSALLPKGLMPKGSRPF
jgi:signal recognition particle subunit SRP54